MLLYKICNGEQLGNDEITDKNNKKKYIKNVFSFQKSMIGTIFSEELPFCCFASMPFFQPCLLMNMRYRTLNLLHPDSEWEKYSCFQGYFPVCYCLNIPQNNFPRCSICLESCFCPSLSVSSTRFLLMDNFNLTLDPCDNRIIRFNNMIMILSCICRCASKMNPDLLQFVKCLEHVSDCVYLSTIGCTVAQINREIIYRESIESVSSSFDYNPLPEIFNNPPIFDAGISSGIETETEIANIQSCYIAPVVSKMERTSSIESDEL
tara:strand:- start:27112 stop:27903 length:792 start_codon:yes stop_codon:yes gene_type:complete